MWKLPAIMLKRLQRKVLYFKWPYFLMAFLTGALLFARWNSADDSLKLFNFIDFTRVLPYIDREEAFAFLFDDFLAIYWIAVVLWFLPKFILGEVVNSFTVSNQLYLKMSPLNSLQLAFYRVALILLGAFLYSVIPLVGALLYCLIHQFPVRGPLISIGGLFGHIVWAGGLLLVFPMAPTADMADRRRWMYFFILIPVLFYIFGNRISDNLDGFFPFTAPYGFRIEGFKVVKSFGLGILLGMVLFCWHLVKAGLQTRKYYQTSSNNIYEN